MNFFLRIKHWQLFTLLFGLPFFFQIGVMVSVASSHNPSLVFKFFPWMMIFFIAPLFSWMYVLGINLNKKLPDTVKMNVVLFKWFFFIPVIYIVYFCILIYRIFNAFFVLSNPSDAISFAHFFILIFPIHLFSMFCIFYCNYFIAKCLKAVELQKQVTFSDYAGEFFLLWFFPIGVWLIQPKINKIFNRTLESRNYL
jgi:hypothetical protein